MKNLKFSTLFLTLISLSSCSWRQHEPERKLASEENHYTDLVLLGRNLDAYTAKRKLIQTVKPAGSIDLSYFIIDSDPTSATIMQDLLKKADEGVKVRILVDYFMSPKQVPMLLLLDQHKNIEVRRFRPPTPELITHLKAQVIDPKKFIAGIMYQQKSLLEESLAKSPLLPELMVAQEQVKKFRSVGPNEVPEAVEYPVLMGWARKLGELAPLVKELRTFLSRTHHKLLVVDDNCFVLGGRNLSDEYHSDLGDPLLRTRNYPFQDTDISGCTSGEEQKKSFSKLWNSPRSFRVNANEIEFQTTQKAMSRKDLDKTAEQAGHINKHVLSKSAIKLPDVNGSLYENLPVGILMNRTNAHHGITQAYIRRIQDARKRIDIVTAYFCQSTANKDPALNELYDSMIVAARDHKVAVTIYTNSITSTDLNMVNLVGFLKYRELIQAGVKIMELAPGQGSLHTKSAAFDDDYILIGSYNMDPRSHVYDSNNLLELSDPSEELGLGKKFRKARIDSLKWVPADLNMIDQIMKQKKNEVDMFRAVRDLI